MKRKATLLTRLQLFNILAQLISSRQRIPIGQINLQTQVNEEVFHRFLSYTKVISLPHDRNTVWRKKMTILDLLNIFKFPDKFLLRKMVDEAVAWVKQFSKKERRRDLKRGAELSRSEFLKIFAMRYEVEAWNTAVKLAPAISKQLNWGSTMTVGNFVEGYLRANSIDHIFETSK